MTTTQHRSEAARYRRLYDDTGITAYSVASAHHAAMAGRESNVTGDLSRFAMVEIIKMERERLADRCHVAAARVTCAADCHVTAELPIIETIEDLRAELAARLAGGL